MEKNCVEKGEWEERALTAGSSLLAISHDKPARVLHQCGHPTAPREVLQLLRQRKLRPRVVESGTGTDTRWGRGPGCVGPLRRLSTSGRSGQPTAS